MTRDTVYVDTPARSATSFMFTTPERMGPRPRALDAVVTSAVGTGVIVDFTC